MSEYNEIMKNAKGHEKKYAAFDPNKGKKNIIKLSIVCVIALVLLLCILFRKEIISSIDWYKFLRFFASLSSSSIFSSAFVTNFFIIKSRQEEKKI